MRRKVGPSPCTTPANWTHYHQMYACSIHAPVLQHRQDERTRCYAFLPAQLWARTRLAVHVAALQQVRHGVEGHVDGGV